MKFDPTNNTHLISCANALTEIYNKERRSMHNQIDSFMGIMTLANLLSKETPTTFLGFSLGALTTNNGTSGPGMGVWLGIGPILPDTGFYNTVIYIHIEMFALGHVAHTPIIYTNLRRPENIQAIKNGIASALDSIPFEFNLEGEDIKDQEFAKFMKNLGVN